MEEVTKIPAEINSADINDMLQTSITWLDRKRKLQAEQLGIPQPKLICLNQGFALEYKFSSSANTDGEGFYRYTVKRDFDGMARADESDPASAKDSNSVAADAESAMSVSEDTESDQGHSEVYSFDQPSTSSINWRSNSSRSDLFSLESRSVVKSMCNKLESTSTDKEHDSHHHDFGLHACMNYEDHLLEFGGHVDCSEYKTDFEECTDKELEDILYSNGVTPNNYVLSSGRSTVNPDSQQSDKKLTIDKEFEQYFSTLML